jgi:hypothetical protein
LIQELNDTIKDKELILELIKRTLPMKDEMNNLENRSNHYIQNKFGDHINNGLKQQNKPSDIPLN